MKVPYKFFGHVVWVEQSPIVPKELEKDSGVRRAFGHVYTIEGFRPPIKEESHEG
jgi:hypothetical protein